MPCSFDDLWLEKPEFKFWLRRHPKGLIRKAFCSVCKKDFDIASNGTKAVVSHASGLKHKRNEAACKGMVQPIRNFMATPASSTAANDVNEPSSTSSNSSAVVPYTSCPAGQKQGALSSSVTSSDVLKAEILWVLKCTDSHYSMNSCVGLDSLFRTMFPDSEIARKFACADKKSAYLATFDLGPFFKNQLVALLKSAPNYVLLFDETLNTELQEKQMDIHLRFWVDNTVITHFFDSKFLGLATAEHLANELSPLITSLGHSRILQVSMDGPNVNLKTQDLLIKDIANHTPLKLLDIGTCGLHTLHNAFRAGCAATKWELEEVISAVYYLFKDSPARRENLQVIAEATTTPLKFCRHRWLENAAPAQRVIDLLPNLTAFVSATKTKTIPEPTCKSYRDLVRLLSDPLLKAKLEFFISLAQEVEPILQLYQTDRPMIPFLADDLCNLMKSLMKRIVKEETIQDVATLSVWTVDFQNHLKDPSKVDVGFAAKRSMLTTKASNSDRYNFRVECMNFIKALLKKVLEKSPVKHHLVRCLSWLIPTKMASADPKVISSARKHLELTLHILCDTSRVKAEACDTILKQFDKACDDVRSSDAAHLFQSFCHTKDRVDQLLHAYLSPRKEFSELWKICQMMLLLSHGQATVERGFSLHKQTTMENLKKESLIARRLILQAVRKSGGPTAVPVTKEMLSYASSARRMYEEHLLNQRKEEEKKQLMLKRKAENDELEQMRKRRKQMQIDIISLEKSADEKAQEAEKKGKLSLISESNALRRRAKEKNTHLVDLDKAIEETVRAFANKGQ